MVVAYEFGEGRPGVFASSLWCIWIYTGCAMSYVRFEKLCVYVTVYTAVNKRSKLYKESARAAS